MMQANRTPVPMAVLSRSERWNRPCPGRRRNGVPRSSRDRVSKVYRSHTKELIGDVLGGEVRGGADGRTVEELCPQLDLCPQSGHVAGNERLNFGVRVEVAVGALRLAEGDVDVGGYGLHEAAAIQ